ncbi:hypothetical protein [Saccharicrinis sp. 156]|uniref:HzsA-related protein n=1 Tax=Saccharicrinis sp. 156 TaxID=3417574 RepID=UPI003D3351A5
MTGFVKCCRLFSIVLLLWLIACSPNKRKGEPLQPWSERLIELRNLHQSKIKEIDLGKIRQEIRNDYPWHEHAIIDRINKKALNEWFAGKGDSLMLDHVLQSMLNKKEAWASFFEDEFLGIEQKDERSKLVLIEKIARFQEALKIFNAICFEGLEKAILDIESRFPNKYDGKKYKTRIEGLKDEQKQIIEKFPSSGYKVIDTIIGFNNKFVTLQKEALLSNPLINEASLVFVTREQYAADHHNSATLFHTDEINTEKYAPGGSMKVIDLKRGGKITTLIKSTEGVVRDPEISYDGKKIIFAMRNSIDEDYHIYEMDIDGNNMKQLTAAKGVADIDPQYLPNGDIVFTSTREPKYCMCNVHIMGNIFKMEADGANITQLGKSTLFEGHSTVMPDGRILYDRWEYVDRNFGDAQGLWTMNPDGTNQAIYFGNNTNSPGGFIDARPIPGTDKVISVMGSCHDRPWGALGIINRKRGVDGQSAVEKTWPAAAIDLVGKGGWDTFKQVRPYYEDPFPLNDTYFLCSRSLDASLQMGIFLIDTFGNEVLIHTEKPGCYDPIIIGPHKKEREVKEKRNYKSQSGRFYVQDVYQGTHMKGVKRGTVKYLRVVESVEKRSWTVPAWNGQGVHRPAMNWHSFECKKILGTVPVHEDGSAYVEVPSDKYVFFQLLDENKMMVQSMRSGTMVHSGEVAGCIGCHDDRRMAPPSSFAQVPEALTLPPAKLDGWLGDPRNFGFMKEVQPVFDRHCVKCHDFGKKAGKKLLLSADRNPYFNAAYIDMHMKKVIAPVGAGPSEIQQAYSWGSHPSKMIKMIKNGHAGVKLSREEMERLTTWIDLNAVYYPDFISAYPDNPVGRSPISQNDLNRLGQLTQVDFNTLRGHRRGLGPQISFERPEKSPCLANIKNKNSKEYKEALAILAKGKEELENIPRLDMDGFIPSSTDQIRLDKYIYRQKEEKKSREAIREGKKHYDEGVNVVNR